MTQAAFTDYMIQIATDIAGRPLDDQLQSHLNDAYGPQTAAFGEIEALCHEGIAGGWICEREAGGIKYGRVLKPSGDTHDFSVDVVQMGDVKGPHHVHTTGEIGMIMPISKTALFDGQARGWYVYPPGSAHHPTVTGGDAVILYLLPGGQIEFTGQ